MCGIRETLLQNYVRASMVARLLRPYEYTKELSAGAGALSESTSGLGDGKEREKGKGRVPWEPPDISILFKICWIELSKGVLGVWFGGVVEGGGEVGQGAREEGRRERRGNRQGEAKRRVRRRRRMRSGNVQVELDYLGFAYGQEERSCLEDVRGEGDGD